MVKLAKLDTYDCMTLSGVGVIRVKLSRTNDPILVDIMSDIHNSSNKVYLDGCYYHYMGHYEIVKDVDGVFLELQVTETKTA